MKLVAKMMTSDRLELSEFFIRVGLGILVYVCPLHRGPGGTIHLTTGTRNSDPILGNIKMSRIRLVLFDAFDTLITPRLPIHVQYAQEAHKHGLPAHIITPDSVRAAFKPSFKKITAQYPEWGRTARPAMTPSEWWMLCIEETMRTAGAEEGKLREVMPRLGKALLDRFESAQGYRAFDDVVPCCK
jgi:hypothetical protein